MWAFEATEFTKANHEKIWAVWADVGAWHVWDRDLEWAKLKGSFVKGAVGKLKPKGGPTVSFILVEVVPGQLFTVRSKLPLAHMDFLHILEDTKEGIKVTHRVEIGGLLGFVFSRMLGRSLAKGLPSAVKAVIRRAGDGN